MIKNGALCPQKRCLYERFLKTEIEGLIVNAFAITFAYEPGTRKHKCKLNVKT